jgi:hypothetical protein
MVVLSFSIMFVMSFMISSLLRVCDSDCVFISSHLWEAKYVANDTKIEKHNENLKKVLSTCTEIKQDINQKMNHSNMESDSEHMVPVFIKTVTLNNKGLSDWARFSELTSIVIVFKSLGFFRSMGSSSHLMS